QGDAAVSVNRLRAVGGHGGRNADLLGKRSHDRIARIPGAGDVGAGLKSGDDGAVGGRELIEKRIDRVDRGSHFLIGRFAHLLDRCARAVQRGGEIGGGRHDRICSGRQARRICVGGERALQVGQHGGGGGAGLGGR